MSPEEFRRAGHEVVDWIADYLAGVGEYPVLPRVQPGEIASRLPAHAPECGEPMERILDDFRQIVVPGMTHWNHPRFFAYFGITGSGPGILGEMLSAALNVNGMLWRTSPSATELEQVALGWLREWIGLPADFFGIIYDTASVSTLHAIAAARERADPSARRKGATPGLTLYTSEQSHSSVEKGAIALGIGQDYVRHVPVNERFEMRVDALQELVEADVAAGRRPFCVVATAGTTSTTSVDPIPEIADIAEKYGMWLHVDAAYGGPAAIAPEFRDTLRGAERADSLVTNPHKWMLTPVDVSAFYTRHPQILRRAFSLVAEYLETPDQAVNLMDYGVQLGRRFRALKLWFVMRYFGRERIAAIIREHCEFARRLAASLEQDGRFEICAPVRFSVVCFRLKGSEERNRALLDAINASGLAFLSHTVLNGVYVLRMAIGNARTTWQDIEKVRDFIFAWADAQ
ncbi:MAG TPA: aminotransferase class I/II-fold pyridoxal phosphate-dependent enzyme [Bryobacteraceae bacterium]|nr:aminotransferase class I/II-fold pyridoxal phosphate-dependent enzyme [Bryobacteraceae bacterium]